MYTKSKFVNLSGKGAIAKRQVWEIVRAGYGAKRAGYGWKINFDSIWSISSSQILKFRNNMKMNQDLMLFWLSRDNLPKTKNGTYVINLDEYADIGTHWIALFCRKTEAEIKHYRNKSIKANIFRAQTNYSIMCGFYCTGFIHFMLAGKKFADFTNLLSPYDFEKNDF